ncbi:hypothetical protein EIG99_03380 [Staphylococcus condimenti]|uniref:Uncharacterized protein n=1 Tax=Staphylococcus condimenti TaxID=70255 RepID=A0A4Q7CVJ1_9STAP|nr:hypothetical protein [Staphylococcus condimenti]RZI01668.1 hypothetical protein EIG98_10275 [Staphylococcus condimenti]RZI03476.1 hypothetical protein EIG99_03380 [Staphylococcus condimenti]
MFWLGMSFPILAVGFIVMAVREEKKRKAKQKEKEAKWEAEKAHENGGPSDESTNHHSNAEKEVKH